MIRLLITLWLTTVLISGLTTPTVDAESSKAQGLSQISVALPLEKSLETPPQSVLDRSEFQLRYTQPEEVDPSVTFNVQTVSSPEAFCSAEWMGPATNYVNNWYTGGESYAVYQNPIELGCSETYPFSVTDIHWELYNVTASTLNLTNFAMRIWDVDYSVPGCPRPGTQIWSSGFYNLPLPSHAVFDISASLGSPICVSGPYFVGFYCQDNIGQGSIGLVGNNPTPDPIRACAAWNDWGAGWQDLNDHGWPLDLCLWSEGQSSTSNSCVCAVTVVPNPVANALSVSPTANLTANIPGITLSSINSMTWKVSGSRVGPIGGAFSTISSTATFNPSASLPPGELVTSTLTNDVKCSTGFLKNGYTWQFTSAVEPSLGTFSPGGTFDDYAGDRHAMACADFNGDGYVDLATTAYFFDSVSVRINDGNGQYLVSSRFHIGTDGYYYNGEPAIFAGDLDNDGDIDLAVSASGSGSFQGWVAILLNTGSGTFGPPQFLYSYIPGYGDILVTAVNGGDLDGDGDIDLVVCLDSDKDHSLVIHKNNGDGTFAPPVIPWTTGHYVDNIEIADIDNDGDLDLIMSLSYSYTDIIVLRNNGDGNFATPVSIGAGDVPRNVAVGDLDSDGRVDLAYAHANGVSVQWQYSNGTFGSLITFQAGSGPMGVELADLDGDGDLDMAVSSYTTDSVFVVMHLNNRLFASTVGYAVGDLPWDLLAADVDGDGDMDLVTVNSGSDDITVLLNDNASTSCCGQYTSGQTGNVDCSADGKRNLADITLMIDRVYISKTLLCCEENGNVDGDVDGKINLADITRLIDHVYITKTETVACE